MRVVVALQIGFAGRRHRSRGRRRKHEEVGIADLGLEAVHRVGDDRRQLEPADDGLRNVLAQDQLPFRAGVAKLGVAVLAQDAVEAGAVEGAVRPAERAIGHDHALDLVVADGESELHRLLGQQRVGEKAAEDLVVDAEALGLLAVDGALLLLLKPGQLVLVGVTVLLNGDLVGADAGDLVGVVAGEAVADAPDRERADDEHQHHAEDGAAEEVLRERAHLREHGKIRHVRCRGPRALPERPTWCMNGRALATFAQCRPRC